MRRAGTLLLGLVLAAVVAGGCEWNFETLDGHQNGPTGQALGNTGAYGDALVYNGRPHVFYYSFTSPNADLRHAYWNGSFWAHESLDGHQSGPHGQIATDVGAGFMSAILYNGRPHVFYYDQGNADLRHGYWNGSFWSFETLDGSGGPNGRVNSFVGRSTSATLYNGRPHVFYYDETNMSLRHGYWNGLFWSFETLDGAGGPNGRVMSDVGDFSTVTLYNGRPHVFYYDDDDLALRHAYYTGSAWGFETLDGNGGPNGRIMAEVGVFGNEALVYHSRPHVFYRDNTNGDLRHGYWNGFTWVFETLDGAGGPNGRTMFGVGTYNSAFVDGERLRVFNYETTSQTLRHAYYTGSAWGFETLDGNGGPNGRTAANVGQYVAALKDGTKPRVFYMNNDAFDLRHAYFG